MSRHQPNIILIVADDLGYGDIGCFGNPIVRTPHLDRLASQGVALTQHYTASSLCAPARAALMTGLYNHRTGAVDVPSNRGLDRIDPHCKTIGDHFAAAGYKTGMVGKWHNGAHAMAHHPNARGFQEFLGFLNGGMDYWQWALDRNGQTQRCDGRYLTDVFSDEACAFIKRHAGQPSFLMLTYNTPHTPLQAPDALIKHYRQTYTQLTDEVCILYAMIEAMDTGIGRLLETLKKTGEADNTIVMFTSDNGPVLAGAQQRYNGPFRGEKRYTLEGGIRVPMIISWPDGLPAGIESNHMTHFCDHLPTLASLANISLCEDFQPDGYDVTDRLRGEPGNVPDVRYWQRNRYQPVPHSQAAMRDGPWKLYWPVREHADRKMPEDNAFYWHGLTAPHWLMDIDLTLPDWTVGPAQPPELYHLDDDPSESNDLATTHPDRVANMTRAWDHWFEQVDEQRKTAWRRTRVNAP